MLTALIKCMYALLIVEREVNAIKVPMVALTSENLHSCRLIILHLSLLKLKLVLF